MRVSRYNVNGSNLELRPRLHHQWTEVTEIEPGTDDSSCGQEDILLQLCM